MIRPVSVTDAEQIAAIYNYYVQDTVSTFEEDDATPAEMARRIDNVTGAYPWLVAEQAGILTGYAYAGPWQSRACYRFTVETTVYVAESHLGKGFGADLYAALLEELRGGEFHCAVAGIALPNPSGGSTIRCKYR